MGRVKSQAIKTNARKIYKMNPETFSENFNENKAKVDEYADIKSKKLRNVICGYITRLVKQSKEEI